MLRRLVFELALVCLLAVGTGVATAELVGHWPLDEGQGTSTADASGNAHDGTIVGTATWVEGAPDFHTALQFGTSGCDGVECGEWDPSEGTDELSVTCWVNFQSGGSQYQGIVASRTNYDNANNHWALEIGGDGGGYYFGSRNGSAYGLGTAPEGEWAHIAITFDGESLVAYLNGEESGTGSPSFGDGTETMLRIGSSEAAGNIFEGAIDDVRVFNHILSVDEVAEQMTPLAGGAASASAPVPANEATDVPRDLQLNWKAVASAVTRDVYLGTDFDDVNDGVALVSPGQDANSYDAGRLEFGQTYYWRVDEVNGAPDFTVHTGPVWSFTTEPRYYQVKDVVATASIPTAATSGGPEATVDASGLIDGMHDITEDTMWSGPGAEGEPVWLQYDFDRVYKVCEIRLWNYNGLYEPYLGFGLKDVTIEYATESDEWIALGDFQLDPGPGLTTYAGQTIDANGIVARAIRININSSQKGGSTYGLSEIQFFQKPVSAREPEPADAATEVSCTASLSWRSGREAASHQVHLGTVSDEVADGAALVDADAVNPYDPGVLTLGTTYYWKVDEVNDAETPSIWDSAVWSFTTQEFFSIDNFESYTADEGKRIYETWTDGYNVGTNGSMVGHEILPFVEEEVVHSGRQSMPFYYTNTDGVANSEAELAFDSPQDWTANGADTLSMWFRGDPVPFLEKDDGTILMSGVGSDIYGSTDEFRYAYKQLTGNGSITARVDRIDNTNEWAKIGVMIRGSLEVGAMQAHMIATPSNRVEWMPRLTVGADAAGTATDVNSTPLPVWVRVTRTGNSFEGQYSTDGQTWTTVAGTTAATIEMPDTVYVGLAVCSHVADTACAAEFSSVSTTGTVTGAWQLADLGVEQPTGNELDTFYIAVKDSSGNSKTLVNADPYAVAAGDWTQWTIPLSDLSAAGVNPARVKTLYLGVGDKTQPSQNAAGMLYIDDIAFGHPIE